MCQQLCRLSLWYLSGHIQYLRHIVSVGNWFPWFYISLIPVYHCRIWHFAVIGVESLECMFLKIEGMEKERGVDTPFHTMAIVCQPGCE